MHARARERRQDAGAVSRALGRLPAVDAGRIDVGAFDRAQLIERPLGLAVRATPKGLGMLLGRLSDLANVVVGVHGRGLSR